MKKPNPFKWNKVTPLSKYFAMALFVMLPFIGFILGMKYQTVIDINLSNTPLPDNLNVQASPLLSSWKTYTDKSNTYTFRYPDNYILEENCTKVDYPAKTPCVYSPDYQVVTKPVPPGEGGIDYEVVEQKGFLLLITPLETPYAYEPEAFCHPGGPGFYGECQEMTLARYRYASRLLIEPMTGWNMILIDNGNAVVDFSSYFSSDSINQAKDLTTQIVSSFKLSN